MNSSLFLKKCKFSTYNQLCDRLWLLRQCILVGDPLQIRVLRQDGSPVTGTKQKVIMHTDITSPVSKPFPLQPTPYYWGPQTTTFQLNNQILTLPDTGLVEVKIEIPKNASKVNLQVCLKNRFSWVTFLTRLNWKRNWALIIAYRPSVRLFVCKLFTFSSQEPLGQFN